MGEGSSTLCTIVLLVSTIVSSSLGSKPTELKLVNVLFRHGDRTPDPTNGELYPNDPYLNYNFYPEGLGELTIIGKRRTYAFGHYLRKRYNGFLGDVYTRDILSARSTDLDRTKMSLSLVLAALYPPAGIQKWSDTINWQPIPFKTLPANLDALLRPYSCPSFSADYNRLENTYDTKKILEEYADVMRNLTKFTGKSITKSGDVFSLYWTLRTESDLGLSLPSWTNQYYPDQLRNITIFQYQLVTSIVPLKRSNGGFMVREIIDNIRSSINDTRMEKLYLYSAHDVNIYTLLRTLGFNNISIPEFTSAVIIELHLKEHNYYVKLLHYLGVPPVIKELRIPGCEVLCSFDQFVTLTADMIPLDKDLECQEEK